MTLFDDLQRGLGNLLGLASPAAAARRESAQLMRRQLGRLSSSGAFDGAASSRRWHNRNVTAGSADADLDEDTLDALRERSRDRARNDPIAGAAVQSIVDNVVGCGFRPSLRLDADALGLSEERARELQHQAGMVWDEWGRYADSTNRLSVDELQALVLGSALVSGDVFVQPIMVTDARVRSRYELKLEVIEGDRVDTPDGAKRPERIRNGIELGRRGQPIAYWVHLQHPGDTTLPGVRPQQGRRSFRRVQAHNDAGRPNILHVYHQDRPGQSRGRPVLSAVLDQLKDRADYREAELVAAQVGACFSAFITKADPWNAALQRATSDTRAKNERHEELSPGGVYYLGPGESVNFGNPTRPSSQFDAFVQSITSEIMAGLGMPKEVALRDFSGTTYSQARAALLEARRMFSRRQKWLVSRLLQPVWEMVLEEAWLKGLWDAGDDFAENFALWTRTVWVPPGWGWIDPQKEVIAWEKALQLGVTTRQKILRSMDGEEFSDVARDLVEEEKMLEALRGEDAAQEPEPEPPEQEPDEPADEDDDEQDEQDEDAEPVEDEKQEQPA